MLSRLVNCAWPQQYPCMLCQQAFHFQRAPVPGAPSRLGFRALCLFSLRSAGCPGFLVTLASFTLLVLTLGSFLVELLLQHHSHPSALGQQHLA